MEDLSFRFALKPFYYIFSGSNYEAIDEKEPSNTLDILPNDILQAFQNATNQNNGYPISIVYLEKVNEKAIQSLLVYPFNVDDSNENPPNPRFNKDSDEKEFIPVIFLGLEPLFSKVTKVNPEQDGEHKYEHRKALWKKIGIPGCYSFFDSSIWNFYISLRDVDRDNQFRAALIKIQTNYERKLYQTTIAQEYIEFATRLAVNSKLQIPKAHGTDVSPFVFHSEKHFNRNIQTETDRSGKKLKEKVNAYNWRFLLVDDFADEQLNPENEKTCSKKDILKKLVKDELGFNVDEETIPHLKICVAPSIEEAKQKLRNTFFDIVLMDYLLGYKPTNYENSALREYGHELLKEIDENSRNYQKGPLGRFWFLNISSFSTAFLDQLRQEGLDHNTTKWYFSRGADMVNEPELFKYELLQLVSFQIEEAEFSEEAIWAFLTDKMAQFEDTDNDSNLATNQDYVSQCAVQIIGEFMHRFGRINLLEHDKENGSLFAKSVLDKLDESEQEKNKAKILFLHVKELLLNLAFGTSMEADLMLEEYNYLKSKIEKNEAHYKQAKSALSSIKLYIEGLKEKADA